MRHLQFLLAPKAGWVNRSRQDVIDYLQAENRILRGLPRAGGIETVKLPARRPNRNAYGK